MELWVRSQDKKNLVKIINQISLNYCDEKTIIANYKPDFIGTQGEYYEKMGTYATKERALEVLDEIQKVMVEKSFSKKRNGLNQIIDIYPNPICLYQMPEE